MIKYFFPLVLLVVNSILNVSAATIEEVTIIAKRGNSRALQPAVILESEALQKKIATVLTDIFTGIPSVGIRTNSRGESVIRLRGSDERQTALFLDGAPLSVPWDGRVDLSVLPAGLIDNVRIVQSAAPVEYGANAMLGAVALSTRSDCQEVFCQFQMQSGQRGSQSYSAIGGTMLGKLHVQYAGTYRSRDGLAYASRQVIPFAPVGDGEQDNTDMQSRSFWGAVAYSDEAYSLRLSRLSVDSSRGIAPAGHLDPDIKAPRYWRYPDWHLNQTTLNSSFNFDNDVSLQLTGWHQDFAQTINQYTDASYNTLEESEKDKDTTWGARIIAARDWQNVGVRLVSNLQSTAHKQIDTTFDPLLRGKPVEYQQDLLSVGGEIDSTLSENIKFSLSTSYDYSKTPKTGGRESQQSLSDWAVSAALVWLATSDFTVSTTLGRRTRFPALRELYGASLGKFLLNPNLQAETAWLGDITFAWEPYNYPVNVFVTPWVTSIDNTLSKRRVIVDGNSLEQRYNLKGSTGHGLDVSTTWYASERLVIEFGSSWQQLQANRSSIGEKPEIFQRPKYQASLTLDYLFTPQLSGQFVVQRTGEALDEDVSGDVVTLEASTQLDARVFYSFMNNWQVYAVIDNLTNETVLPQLGLPAQGRLISVGLKYTL